MTENLHRHVGTNFGTQALRLVREYERTSRKLADYRNHLRFNLKCRQNKIIPRSLQLGSTVKGHRAEQILQKAQLQLLSERIRQVHFTIEALTTKVDQIVEELTPLLSRETLEDTIKFVEKAQTAQHVKGKERQTHKFESLQSRVNHLNRNSELAWRNKNLEPSQTEKREDWVKNLSDRNLTQAEKDVLSKGLNFAVTPEQIPVVDLITATESAIRNNKVPDAEAEQLRLKVTAALTNAKAPPSNLTTQERRALASLKKDQNITILPADKGRCTVVLNTTDYHTKMSGLLSDSATYETLKRDPTSSYKKKTITLLQNLEKENVIDRPLYYRLYPGEATPCIYGLPKIHKEGAPLRPIVSSINSVTYNIAKHLATILSPLVGNTPHHVKNSQDFALKIQEIKLDSDETMVSYDVTSLFTCIPTTEAVKTVRRKLLQDQTLQDRTLLTPDHICALLDLCLTTTYFQYRENYYRQKHGCAMGSPVSPIVANLYMEEVENRALAAYTGTAPSHWFRYVDDTWVKIRTQEVKAFTDHINRVDCNIKFTREDVKDNVLPFLDCSVHLKTDRSLNIEVYRKPTHTDQYLLFDSHHPLQHKLGVIRTLNHRAQNIPTRTEGKVKEQKHIRNALKTCGYPNWAFVKSNKTRNKNNNEQEREDKRKPVVIPYIAGVSEKLKRIFSKHKIPMHFKAGNTLRQKLVHPKDKIPRHKQSNVVYAVQCSEECEDRYIGETKQPLHKRMSQHRRANSSGPDSAVHLHLKDTGHSFEDSDVQVLAREDRWFERGVKEAIFVKLEKPSLNRGGGLRHNLSPTYNSVLASITRKQGNHSHLRAAQGNHSHLRAAHSNSSHQGGETATLT